MPTPSVELGTPIHCGATIKYIATDGGALEPLRGGTVIARIKPATSDAVDMPATENTAKPGRYWFEYLGATAGIYQWTLISIGAVKGRMSPPRSFTVTAPKF